MNEDDIKALVLEHIDDNWPDSPIDTDQIYYYFDQVYNDSYYPEDPSEVPEIVDELAERIMAEYDDENSDNDDDDEENYGFM